MTKVVNNYYAVSDNELVEIGVSESDFMYEFHYELASAEGRVIANMYLVSDKFLDFEDVAELEDEMSLLARMEADIDYDIVKYSISNL